MRDSRDPARPAVNTAVAAARLGLSRYSVARAVEQGRIPGYGIAGPQRTRWYVYEDALPRAADPPPENPSPAHARALLMAAASRADRDATDTIRDKLVLLLAQERSERAHARHLHAEADIARARAREADVAADETATQALSLALTANDSLAASLRQADRTLAQLLLPADDASTSLGGGP